MCAVVKISSYPMHTFQLRMNKVEFYLLVSAVRLVNRYLLHGLFGVVVLTAVVFLVADITDENNPKCSTEVPHCVPKGEQAVMCLTEK